MPVIEGDLKWDRSFVELGFSFGENPNYLDFQINKEKSRLGQFKGEINEKRSKMIGWFELLFGIKSKGNLRRVSLRDSSLLETFKKRESLALFELLLKRQLISFQ